MGARRLLPYILPRRENVTIINNTVNVTKIVNVNNVMIFNEGPDFRQIQRRTEQPIRWARLERRWDVNRDAVRSGQVRNRFEGDVFRVLRLVLNASNREEKAAKSFGNGPTRSDLTARLAGSKEGGLAQECLDPMRPTLPLKTPKEVEPGENLGRCPGERTCHSRSG